MEKTMNYQPVMTEQEKEERRKAVRRSARRVHAKAEAVGIFYLLFTIILTVAVCLPLYTGTPMGDLWVANFWKPFLELKNIKGNVIPVVIPAAVSLLYAFILLSALVNFLGSLAQLGKLFKKTWTEADNYNRNRDAMVKLARKFKGTYSAMIVFGFIMHLIGGVTFTPWFYVAVLLGLIAHFWLGLVGGNVSRFVFVNTATGKRKEELKRPIGRFAPFMRNLLQIVIVASVMYFISRMNVMTNAWVFVQKNAFKEILDGPKFNAFLYGVWPLLQLLMCIWTLGMFKHAIGLNEYEFYGNGKQKGRKTFGWFAFMLLITAGGAFALTYIASTKRTWFEIPLGTLYIAALALAAIILELTTRRLPNMKRKAAKQESVASETTEATTQPVAAVAQTGYTPVYQPTPVPVSQEGYYVPLGCITQPAVFMQPNGTPVMVMPMVAGPAPAPVAPVAPAAQPTYQYTAMPQPAPMPSAPVATVAPASSYAGYTSGVAAETPAVSVQAVRTEAAYERPTSTLVREEETVPTMNGPVGGVSGVALTREQADAAAANNQRAASVKEKWVNMAGREVPGENSGFTGKDFLRLPKTEAVRLSEEDLAKPLPAKRWAVACPDCGTKLNVKEGAFAYRCPECGDVFRLNRVYRNKAEK
ncbi:MAG: hypothetical protein IJY62_00435 [Clostridia bacterium]|nr:hypothetical protein [Clostridia bacterium]